MTDTKGRFAIELERDGRYDLLFWPKNHAAVIAYDVSAGTDDLKVSLPEGGTVTGRVVRVQNGRKVPVASVEVKAEQSSRGAFTHLGFGRNRKTITDSQGRFRFDHLRTKMRSVKTRDSKEWEYVPRYWKISWAKTSRAIAFHKDSKIENVELVVEPDFTAPLSLVGKPLPELDGIKIEFNSEQAKNRKVLFCFFDMNQRPSRHVVRELSKRAEDMKGKGVVIVAVQAAKVDEKQLDGWVKKYNIPFPAGMIKGDQQKTRFAWGVRSLPWLILTDWKHTVRAEGFGIAELDDKLDEAAKWDRIEGRVTDPNGQPIANAEVRIHRHVTYYCPPEITETDEQGYYRLPAVDWPYRIGAKWKEPLKNGYRRQLMWQKRIFEGSQIINFEFDQFPRGNTAIRATVVDHNNNPVPKFHVWLYDKFDRYAVNWEDPNGGSVRHIDYGLDVNSQDGTLKITGLAPNDYHLDISPESEYCREGAVDVTLREGETANPAIKLDPARLFYGRVLFKDGSPAVLAGEKTMIWQPTTEAMFSGQPIDEDGYFAMDLTDYDIELFKTGKKQLTIALPDLSDQGYTSERTIFPFEYLSTQRDKAGVVEVTHPQPNPAAAPPLLSKPLPKFDGINVEFSSEQAKDKKVLVCFWDMNQRPSRHLVRQLAKRAEELKEKGVVALLIHTTDVGLGDLHKWVNENNIPFTLGTIKKDNARQVLFEWAVRGTSGAPAGRHRPHCPETN
jgi:hypothetical protein